MGRVTQETVTTTSGTVDGTKNVRYTYDAIGRLLTIEDDNGQTDGGNPDYDYSEVQYTYDWENSGTDLTLEEKQYFAGSSARTTTVVTTADGVRDSLQYPNGRSISFTYDGLHRLTDITESNDTIAEYTFKGGYLQERALGDYNRLFLRLRDQIPGEPQPRSHRSRRTLRL